MKRNIRLARKGYEDAVIESPITRRTLELYKKFWIPSYLENSAAGIAHPEANWDWSLLAPNAWKSFAILARSHPQVRQMIPQGFMYVSGLTKTSRGQTAVDIGLLATAPWNRTKVQPAFGLVGTQLIIAAVDLSFQVGCHGRLTLISLPDAVAFYMGLGFIPTQERPNQLELLDPAKAADLVRFYG